MAVPSSDRSKPVDWSAVPPCPLANVELRRELKPRETPYWHALKMCRHIGVYKPNARICTWTARSMDTKGRYVQHRLASARAQDYPAPAVTALTHCLIVDLDTRLAAGELLPTLPPWHHQENKWRSARYGMDAIIVLDEDNHEVLVTDDLLRVCERLVPVAERLGCEQELSGIARIISDGAGYERQRALTRAAGGDLSTVVNVSAAELRASHNRRQQ